MKVTWQVAECLRTKVQKGQAKILLKNTNTSTIIASNLAREHVKNEEYSNIASFSLQSKQILLLIISGESIF